ncbi:hypothetical protein [Cohnella panacarvi]|uniref:hypothetical protein n=1 Tax=Cohnella panacarvi TaxID=400776 RepID=UPI00047C6328|nr:hypothetical protein [Cohnella panacarvi]
MMDKLIREVLAETIRLAKSEPDTDYEAFVELTDLRQTLVDEVQSRGLLKDDEKALLSELAKYEKVILSRMLALKQEAELGIQRMNATKRQQDAYGQVGPGESIMFDKGV